MKIHLQMHTTLTVKISAFKYTTNAATVSLSKFMTLLFNSGYQIFNHKCLTGKVIYYFRISRSCIIFQSILMPTIRH